ncbi:MAG: SRPBCC family protein [Microthrixaceae bacterium]
MITTRLRVGAPAAAVHELLVDVDSWTIWSPHVASVRSESRRLHDGWQGDTRAFFSPSATPMVVDRVRPDGGYSWHSEVGPWRLDYDNAVQDAGDHSVLEFTARLSGPAARWIEMLAAPLSRLGQRRRMTRLAALAELMSKPGRQSGFGTN